MACLMSHIKLYHGLLEGPPVRHVRALTEGHSEIRQALLTHAISFQSPRTFPVFLPEGFKSTTQVKSSKEYLLVRLVVSLQDAVNGKPL